MSGVAFLNWLRCEIVLNHNGYLSVGDALKLIEERRQWATQRFGQPYIDHLDFIENELRQYSADTTLFSVQREEEAKRAS